MAFGVDEWLHKHSTVPRPGIGLRPGGERPDLEPLLAESFNGFFTQIKTLAQTDSVVVDSGIHQRYRRLFDPWQIAEDLLGPLPVLRVHLDCPVEVIRSRYLASGRSVAANGPGVVGDPLERWQEAIASSCLYDHRLDANGHGPNELLEQLLSFLHSSR